MWKHIAAVVLLIVVAAAAYIFWLESANLLGREYRPGEEIEQTL